MRAFAKTLFGDLRNLATVGAVVATSALLVEVGLARAAVYVIPPMTLAAAAWLARH